MLTAVQWQDAPEPIQEPNIHDALDVLRIQTKGRPGDQNHHVTLKNNAKIITNDIYRFSLDVGGELSHAEIEITFPDSDMVDGYLEYRKEKADRNVEQKEKAEIDGYFSLLDEQSGTFSDIDTEMFRGPLETLSCSESKVAAHQLKHPDSFGKTAERLVAIAKDEFVGRGVGQRTKVYDAITTLAYDSSCSNYLTNTEQNIDSPDSFGLMGLLLYDRLQADLNSGNPDLRRAAKAAADTILKNANTAWTMWAGIGAPTFSRGSVENGVVATEAVYESGELQLIDDISLDFGIPAVIRVVQSGQLSSGGVKSSNESSIKLIEPTEDTYVKSGDATPHFGESTLKVGDGNETLLRFDLDQVPDSFVSAELVLSATNQTSPTIDVSRILEKPEGNWGVAAGTVYADLAANPLVTDSIGRIDPVTSSIDVTDALRSALSIGDLNGDGRVGLNRTDTASRAVVIEEDMIVFEDLLKSSAAVMPIGGATAGDINRDSALTCTDVAHNWCAGNTGIDYGFLDAHGFLRGDATYDGDVDFSDLNRLGLYYGATSGKRYQEGDLTFDGAVNFSDLNALGLNYGKSADSIGFSFYLQDSSSDTSSEFASDETVTEVKPTLKITMPTDVEVTAFATNSSNSKLKVDYAVFEYAATPFDITIYRSKDGVTLDAELMTVNVDQSGDLDTGLNSVEFDAQFENDVYEDYFLVAVVDSGEVVAETDESNNSLVFDGGVFPVSQLDQLGNPTEIHVHGRSVDDVVSISASSVTLQGVATLNSTTDQVVVRTHGGSDLIAPVSLSINRETKMFGGAGDDTLQGGNEDDYLAGGNGADTYVFSGTTDLKHDTIIEGANEGFDTLAFDTFTASAPRLNLAQTGLQIVDASHLELTLKNNDSGAASIESVTPAPPPNIEFLSHQTIAKNTAVDFGVHAWPGSSFVVNHSLVSGNSSTWNSGVPSQAGEYVAAITVQRNDVNPAFITDGTITVDVKDAPSEVPAPNLVEGTNFHSTLEHQIVLSSNSKQIEVPFSNLRFDYHRDGWMGDAFELALLNERGESVVATISHGKTSFLNVTEGQQAVLGNGAELLDGNAGVRLDVSHLPAGTYTLVARLINNDFDSGGDDTTSVYAGLSDHNILTTGNPLPQTTPDILDRGDGWNGEIDFAHLERAAAVSLTYSQTSLNHVDQTLFERATVTNDSTDVLHGPILLGIENLSTAGTIRDADGYSPEGIAYIDISDVALASDGDTFDPGEVSKQLDLVIGDLKLDRFDYELVLWGNVNEAPELDTIPTVELLTNQPLEFTATATDPENDDILFEFASSTPGDMSVDAQTGAVTWSGDSTVGVHTVTLKATDSYGASDTRDFNVSVIAPPANRSPVLTGVHNVDAFVGIPWSYNSTAIDLDGDDLRFLGAATYPGGSISTTSQIQFGEFEDYGRFEWIPPASLVGQTVTVIERVEDGNGGIDLRTFTVTVHPTPNNNPPHFITDPPTKFDVATPVGVSTGNVSTSDGTPYLDLDLGTGVSQTKQVSIEIPENIGVEDGPIDVFLLLDDTKSFTNGFQTLVESLPQILGDIVQEYPMNDVGFGIGRFADYGQDSRPFILNMPIVVPEDLATGEFALGVVEALEKIADQNNGGSNEETAIEALYQIATGAGFDGDGDNETTGNPVGSELAGGCTTQEGFGNSGDVPAYSHVDIANSSCSLTSAAGSSGIGGAGFRPNATKIVILAGDDGTVYRENNPPASIVGWDDVPYTEFESTNGETTLANSATIPDAIQALLDEGIMVVGVANANVDPGNQTAGQVLDASEDPRKLFEAIATVTGAVNRTDSELNGSVSPGLENVIAPGEPLFFVFDDKGETEGANALAASLHQAITASIKSVGAISVEANNETFLGAELVNTETTTTNGLHTKLTFDATFLGDGYAHEYDLKFVDAVKGVIHGSVPVAINHSYTYDSAATDYDVEDIPNLRYSIVDDVNNPSGLTIDALTGSLSWDPGTAVVGNYSFEIKVEDGRGGIDIQQVNVELTSGGSNVAPVITSTPPPAPLAPGDTFTYDVNATDNDGDPVEYFIVGGAYEGMTIDRQSGVFSWLPSIDYTGKDFTVEVVAMDHKGAQSAPQAFDISVQWGGRNASEIIANRFPVFTSSITPQTVFEGETLNVTATATDADGDELTFELPHGPEGMVIAPKTGDIFWTPILDAFQEYPVTVFVRDGNGGFDIEQFVVEYLPKNQAPVILAPREVFVQPGKSVSVPISIIDPDTTCADFGSNSCGTISASGSFSVSATTSELHWTQPAGTNSSTITVTATDELNQSSSRSVTVHPTATVNSPPSILSSAPTRILHGHNYFYDVDAVDPEFNPLEYNVLAAQRLWPSAATFVNTDQEFPQFPGNDKILDWDTGLVIPGFYEITIEAKELGGAFPLSVSQTFNVEVTSTPINHDPVIESDPRTIGIADEVYQYRPTASDRENDDLSWTLEENPNGMTINAETGEIGWAPTIEDVSVKHPVTLVVSDNQGGVDTQTFEVQVVSEDRDPVFTSKPITRWKTNSAYRYQLKAYDPDGGPVTFTTPTGFPSGLTGFDSELGYIVATTPSAAATYAISATAVDENGNTTTQQFDLHIDPNAAVVQNSPPNVDASNITVSPGETVRLPLNAYDPDGDPLTYTLSATGSTTSLPEGLSVTDGGTLIWTPVSLSQTGTVHLNIEVSDSVATDDDTFDIVIAPDTTKPGVAIATSPGISPTGTSVRIGRHRQMAFSVTAWDNVAVERKELQIFKDGNLFETVELDADGVGYWTTPDDSYRYEARATAWDTAGNASDPVAVAHVDVDCSFSQQTCTDPGNFEITSPSSGSVFDGSINVGVKFTHNAVLEYALLGSSDFQQLKSLTPPTPGQETTDTVSELNASLLSAGQYVIRLRAASSSLVNPEQSDSIVVEVSPNGKLGNFSLSFTDLQIPVNGIPITVQRTYDTLRANQSGDFGYGWDLDFSQGSFQVNHEEENLVGLESVFAPFIKDSTVVEVTLPNGAVERFTFRTSETSDRLGIDPVYESYFEPQRGTGTYLSMRYRGAPNGRVASLSLRPDQTVTNGYQLEGVSFSPLDPRHGVVLVLTTNDGVKMVLDANTRKIAQVIDRSGNSVTFGRNAISASNGQSVIIRRDYRNRITEIVDPLGKKIQYEYDAQGDLNKITSRTLEETEFVYAGQPHFLSSIKQNGTTIASASYATDGKFTGLTDANGELTTVGYPTVALSNRSLETLTDAVDAVTYIVRNDRGNVVREVKALRDINGVDPTEYYATVYEYDSEYPDVQIKESAPFLVDPNLNTNSAAFYDYLPQTSDLIWETVSRLDDLGHVENVVSGVKQSELDTSGIDEVFKRGTTFENGPFGEPDVIIDALGNKTENTFDGPNLTNVVVKNAENKILSKSELKYEEGSDRLRAVLDARGRVIHRISYDEDGYLRSSTDARGVERFSYANSAGNVTGTSYEWIDPNNATNIEEVTTSTTYDDSGRITHSYDSFGNLTTTHYDEFGRVSETRSFDKTQLDAHSNNLSTTPLRGRTLNYYDVTGNLLETRSMSLETAPANWVCVVSQTNYDEVGRVTHSVRPFVVNDTGVASNVVSPDIDDGNCETIDMSSRPAKTPGSESIYDDLGRVVKSIQYDDIDISVVNNGNNGLKKVDSVSVGDDVSESTTHYDDQGRVKYSVSATGVINVPTYDTQGRQTRSSEYVGGTFTTDTVEGYSTRFITDFEYDVAGRQNAVHHRSEVYNAISLTNNKLSIDSPFITEGQPIVFVERGTLTDGGIDIEPGRVYYAFDVQRDSDTDETNHGPPSRSTEFWLSAKPLRTGVTPTAVVLAGSHQNATIRPSRITRTEYDGLGRAVKTIFQDGSISAEQFNDVGNRVSVQEQHDLGKRGLDVNSITTEYEYDVTGALTAVILPPVEHPITEELVRPRYEYEYDNHGNQSIIRDNVAQLMDGTVVYSHGDFSTHYSNDNGVDSRETKFTYDQFGRQRTRELPGIPNTESWAYDSNGQLDLHTDFEGRIEDPEYDALGRVTKTSFGTTSDYVSNDFDGLGRTTKVHQNYSTSTDNRTETMTYDNFGRLHTATKPEGDLEYGYDDATGAVTSISTDSNKAASFDGSNDSVTIQDDASLRASNFTLEAIVKLDSTNSTYDTLLMKTSSGSWTDGYGIYYQNGQLVFFINQYTNNVSANIPNNQFVHVAATYDGSTMRLYFDGTEVGSKAVSSINHSTADLLIGKSPNSTLYNLAGVIDEVAVYNRSLTADEINEHSQNIDQMTSDRYARAVLADAPSGYWRLGEAEGLHASDSTGNGLHGIYDGPTLGVSGPFGDQIGNKVNYSYDAIGRLSSVTETTRHGLVASDIEWTVGSAEITDAYTGVEYDYDALGSLAMERTRVSEVTYDDGTHDHRFLNKEYVYDALGRLVNLRHYQDDTEDIIEPWTANGIFDSGETLIAEYDYSVDTDGTRIGSHEYDAVVDRHANFVWSYDSAGRLIEEDRTYGIVDNTAGRYTTTYKFDLVGNRMERVVDYGARTKIDGSSNNVSFRRTDVTDYQYLANDRLKEETITSTYWDPTLLQVVIDDSTTSYEYGGSSNQATQLTKVTSDGSSTIYEYDKQGRLKKLGDEEYRYDSRGTRIKKTNGNDTTKFLIDYQNPTGYSQVIEERNASDLLVRSYLIGLDVVAQFIEAANAGVGNNDPDFGAFLLADGHGSTRHVVNHDVASQSTARLDAYDYDAYGNLIAFDSQSRDPITVDLSQAVTPFLYSGEFTDLETGKQYLRARFYDASTGRFNRLDPFAGDPETPQSLHKYLYVHGDPVNNIDPTGMFSLGTVSVGSSISGNLRSTNQSAQSGALANTGRTIAHAAQRSLAQSINALRQSPHLIRQYSRQIAKHVIGRHTPPVGPANVGKSLFKTSNPRKIFKLIDKTLKTGEVAGNTGGRAGLIFTRTFNSPVGTNAAGHVVHTVKVVVSETGKLITAFPI